MKNEMELVQSKELRMGLIENLDVLDKVKGLILFPKTQIVTVEMASNYFEVPKKTLESTIRRNKDELVSNGLIVLRGVDLTEFKSNLQDEGAFKGLNSLTIVNNPDPKVSGLVKAHID